MSIETHVRKRINEMLNERDEWGWWIYEVVRYYGEDGPEKRRELKRLDEMTEDDMESVIREYRMRADSLRRDAEELMEEMLRRASDFRKGRTDPGDPR